MRAARSRSLLRWWAVLLLLSLLLLAVDFYTGPHIRCPITFLIPIGLAAWFLSSWIAIGLGVVLTIVQFTLRYELSGSHATLGVEIINALIRLAVLVAAAITMGRLRTLHDVLLSRIEVLVGVLPICSYCKSVRSQNGKWEPLEEFIATHTTAKCSHGICEQCATTHYSEFVQKSDI